MSDAASLTLKMIERRDDYRRLVGTQYGTNIALGRKVLTGYAKENGIPLAKAAIRISQDMERAGHDCSLIIAAFVEECEREGKR